MSDDQQTKRLRAILPLGKFRVVERGPDHIKVAMGGSTTMTIYLANINMYDIQDGDLLTYYTEVYLAERSIHVKPS